MAVKLAFAPEAELDIASAYAWYEEQRPGLGEEFLSCLHARIESVRRTPETHAIVYETFRRALLRRFPYQIFYELEQNQIIVYGVIHTSREPNKWKQRLDEI